MDLNAFVGKLLEEQDGDVLREGIRVLSQALMETEVAGLIGAERHERTGERTAYRNGSRTRTWNTRMGTIELAIPKVTPGTYFPSLLQPRRRAEHALLAVVQEAYVHGVSTRKVDDLVKALGVDGISKSVSRICGTLDTVVDAFRTRALTGEHRYLWVECDVSEGARRRPRRQLRTVVAVGITSDGDRQVLGVDVGPSEDRAFWTAFLRSLVKRGLTGVRLVVSDAHEGLKQAISTVLHGAAWQRCRVHFMRNLLATVPQGAREAIAAIVRTIFAQPDHASALAQLRKVAEGLRPQPATVRVVAEAMNPDDAMLGQFGVPAEADTDFRFSLQVPPVALTMRAITMGASGSGWFVSAVTANGVDITESGFVVKPGEGLSGVEIELTSRPTEVHGLVAIGSTLAPGAFVAVFPEDPSRWSVSGQGAFQLTRTDDGGRYVLRRLRAGRYFVVAVPDIDEANWMAPEFLEAIRRGATAFALARGEEKQINLRARVP
nr:IS256 family transposase [Luteitalea sp.]